jgi:hypothetical protein
VISSYEDREKEILTENASLRQLIVDLFSEIHEKCLSLKNSIGEHDMTNLLENEFEMVWFFSKR